MKTRSVDQLLADLVQTGVSYGEALEHDTDPQARGVNKIVLKSDKIMKELKAQGAQERALELLEFAHAGVRLLVASHALSFAPERAVPVLQKMSDGPRGPLCAAAYSALYFWRRRQKNAGAVA